MIPIRLQAIFAVIFVITACGGAPRANKGAEPLWVRSPGTAYNEGRYISAVGHGGNRASAEQGALAALSGRFGQSVQGELVILNTYSEAVRNGRIDFSERTDLREAVTVSTRMDSLIGAEIAEYWSDGSSVHYALAVMDRAATASLYSGMIRENTRMIERLASLPAAGRYSLEAYSRYRLAAVLADANQVFYNVLSVVGGASEVSPGAPGEGYRMEAAAIAAALPIAVQVSNDRDNRIRAAFAESLSRVGFRSGGNGGYTLTADVRLSPLESSGQRRSVDYLVEAALTDPSGAVVFPFSVSGREAQNTLSMAENRAIGTAVHKISETYGEALLASLNNN